MLELNHGRHSHPLLEGAAGDSGPALSLEPDGLRLTPQGAGQPGSALSLIGCSGYHGPTVSLEQMDPALFAKRPVHP
ncbi:hypothetical protein WH5701_14106 [Synechococcus sp. WH 5701]|nr:hypothetical protein WH5701_14106 [Synechococcus sp. WH 5701]